MKVDLEYVSFLLNIVDRCAGHSGKLNSLSNFAMQELLDMNEAIRKAAEDKKRKLQEDEDQRQANLDLQPKAVPSNPSIERKV